MARAIQPSLGRRRVLGVAVAALAGSTGTLLPRAATETPPAAAQEESVPLVGPYAITELGAPDGFGPQNTFAYAINNAGQVAGTAERTRVSEHTARAFLWQDGTMTDLGAPAGYSSSGAGAINDAGQIVGIGQIDEETRAFLLTPLPSAAA